VAVGLFPEWAQRCSINSTDLHPALTRPGKQETPTVENAIIAIVVVME